MKISQMPLSTTPSSDDVLAMLEGGTQNKKISFGAVADWVATENEIDNLDTDNKTIIGAINELNAHVGQDASSITNTASGSIAAFSDGAAANVEALTVNVEPIQNLNGYDSPWPAGGGVNKIDVSKLVAYGSSPYGLTTSFDGDWIVLSGTCTAESSTINFRIAIMTGSVVFPVTNFRAFPNSNSSSHISSSAFGLADDNKTLTIYLTNMVQGETYNLRTKIVGYEASQSAPTSWTPYSNICPIPGRTGATVTRTGKNLFDSTQILQASGWTVENNVYSGTRGAFHVAFSDGFPIVPKFKENTRYTLSLTARLDDGSSYARIGFMYTDGTSTSVADITTTAETQYSEVSAAGKTVSGIYGTYGSGPSVTLYLTNIQLEEGTTVTPYAPYTGTTIPVSWETEAGTVYGGELDVVSGVLTVDRGYFTDDGSANWVKNNDGSFYLNVGIQNPIQTVINRCACNYAPYRVSFDGISVFLRGIGLISLGKGWSNAYSDLASLKAAFAQTPFQMVYPLATPLEYQLTQQQLQTLLGDNVIWSDAGSVEVEYRADTKLYIEQLTKPTEDDMIANASIQNGKFFMIGNRLFVATAAIASGDTINPGTNCTELSLADALNNLN